MKQVYCTVKWRPIGTSAWFSVVISSCYFSSDDKTDSFYYSRIIKFFSGRICALGLSLDMIEISLGSLQDQN